MYIHVRENIENVYLVRVNRRLAKFLFTRINRKEVRVGGIIKIKIKNETKEITRKMLT